MRERNATIFSQYQDGISVEDIDGEYIYIPRKAENKKRWGEVKNSRQYIRERNATIFSQYQDGISVEDIANCNYLSPKTIYKIVANMKS
ncbi:DNA-binding response regulator [bacterium BFN5]|nr:DNA-binding response regulator [bacterium BFN5]QJW49038.1 DNA-binding response regulator [bacterium BFN5]